MATTPNYSFSVYSSTDTDVRFLDFRVATAGSQSTSNFYVIDTVLKQHSDAIDSINATPSAFVVKGTYSSGSLYTASVANYPGYKNEQLIVLSLNQKNTGAVQININGTTNKDVMKYGSDGVLKAVEAGDFVANSPVLCLYDGTRFVVIGITSASSITVTGEAGDILQIADDGTIESSGKKAAQPNGIATLDENGNVVQVANMANSAAAVYSGEPVTVEYAGAQRIASITAYGENAQGGTTDAPVALTGVDSVFVGGRNLLDLSEAYAHGYNITGIKNFLIPRQQYTFSNVSAGGIRFGFFVAMAPVTSEDVGQLRLLNYIPEGTSGTFVAPDDVISYPYIVLGGIRAGIGDVFPNVKMQLEIGATAHPYEPYNGNITQLPIPRELHRIGDVADKCVTRAKSIYDKRLELDGTESNLTYNTQYSTLLITGITTSGSTTAENVYGVCTSSHFSYIPTGGTSASRTDIIWSQPRLNQLVINSSKFNSLETAKAYFAAQKAEGTPVIVYYQSTAYDGTNGLDVCLTEYQTGYIESYADESITTAWISSTGELSTGAEVAYVLSSPETYATDPVDFDNAAGPLTVMTGGQVEVKMTDFVTDRTPAFLNKLDKTGDGSDVTVTFTEAATDTDIASGDKLSILFGKILKRFSTITSKFTTVDNSITQIESDISDITDGTTVVAQANKVTNALVIMSNSGTALVNYDGSATANMTLSPSNVGAEPAFTKNTAFNKNFGSSAGTVCQGNDSRLSNARRSSNISMSLSGTNLSISYS